MARHACSLSLGSTLAPSYAGDAPVLRVLVRGEVSPPTEGSEHSHELSLHLWTSEHKHGTQLSPGRIPWDDGPEKEGQVRTCGHRIPVGVAATVSWDQRRAWIRSRDIMSKIPKAWFCQKDAFGFQPFLGLWFLPIVHPPIQF